MKPIAAAFLLWIAGTAAFANPFVPGATGGADRRPALESPRLVAGPRWFADAQRKLNARVAALARQAKEQPTAAPVLLALALAFAYGMLHALGPGHGKIFTLNYFLSEKPDLAKGFLFGAMMSFLDSLSALALVSAAYFVLKVAVLEAAEGATRTLRIVSYLLITGIGVWHLIAHIRHDHGHGHEAETRGAGHRRLLPMAISIGLVPCPVAMVLLVFGLSLDAFGFGIVLTVFLSLGATVALTLLAIGVMALKTGALSLVSAAERSRVTHVVEVAGSSMIVLFGVVLLASVA